MIECNVELFFGSEKKSRYEISVKLKNKFNNGIFKSKKSLMRNEYSFFMKINTIYALCLKV